MTERKDYTYRMMNAYVRKRPELVSTFDLMMEAYRTALKTAGTCPSDELEPFFVGLIHPIAGIWHIAVTKAQNLTKTSGPIFALLNRMLDNEKASIRQRLFHCLSFQSSRPESMQLVDRLANDSAINSRVIAYWMTVRFEQTNAKNRIEKYLTTEKSKKGLESLREILEFVQNGYLTEKIRRGIRVYAFNSTGYSSSSIDENEIIPENIQKVVERIQRT